MNFNCLTESEDIAIIDPLDFFIRFDGRIYILNIIGPLAKRKKNNLLENIAPHS